MTVSLLKQTCFLFPEKSDILETQQKLFTWQLSWCVTWQVTLTEVWMVKCVYDKNWNWKGRIQKVEQY